MISIIITIISFALDILFSNLLPFMKGDLSLFTPLLVPITIYLVYPFYQNKEKYYLIYSIIVGIIYDLIFTNLLFVNGIIFLMLGVITIKLNKTFEVNKYTNIINITFIIILYEAFFAGLIFVLHLVPITISSVIYKITHTLIMNIIYGMILYLIVDKITVKYKKVFINK